MSHIFHVTTASELAAGTKDGLYRPARFSVDGFVHCTEDEETAREVARAYFANAKEPILLLTVETERLRSPVKREPPAPVQSGAQPHHRPNRLFPHVYGPIEVDAIETQAKL